MMQLVFKAVKKPYGHTAYTRRTKGGKMLEVQAKGAPKSLANFVFENCTPTLAKSLDSLAVTAMTVGGKVRPVGEGKFGARQVVFSNGLKACLKPKNHSTELYRGVRRDAQHLHEVAAYQLDRQLLKFGVIPPAILSMYRGQQASIAQWVTGHHARDFVLHVFNRARPDWKERVALLATKINVDAVRRLVIFDLIVNNTDRHAKNCLFERFSNQVWGIDNGLAFGSQYHRYYNVFHRFLFRNRLTLTDEERARLKAITKDQLQKVLGRYLTPLQIEETYWRLQWVLEHRNLGFGLVSEGRQGRNDFPDNKEWFRQKLRGEPQNRVIAGIQGMGALVPA